MSRYFLTSSICAAAFLCTVANKCCACDEPPWVYIINWSRYIPLSYYQKYPNDWEGFKGIGDDPDGCTPPDSGSCLCPVFEWSIPSGVQTQQGYPIDGCYDSDDGGYRSWLNCRFTSTGVYRINLSMTDDEFNTASDTARIVVFENDVDIAGVSDDLEENPGGFVGVDGLVEVSLSFAPSDWGYGFVDLYVSDNWNVIVWADANRTQLLIGPEDDMCWWYVSNLPNSVYVEGWGAGTATLYLEYSNDGRSYPGGSCNEDKVKITVVKPDLDIENVNEEDEETIGGFIPLCGKIKVIMQQVQPNSDNMPDEVILDVTSGSGKIRVWNMDYTPLNLPATFNNESLSWTVYVEGIGVSSTPRDITLVQRYTAGGKIFEDKVNLTVYSVDTVEFKKYMDNNGPDDHPNSPPNGGKRIFPDKKTYNDSTPDRRKVVKVKATITPILDNRHVYFTNFDVDDPSDSPIIDGNGSVGGDNKGGTGSLSSTNTVTDGSGEAIVEFTVSMYPGDNFRIAAAACLGRLEPTVTTQTMADANTPPTGVKFSPMLTVWRHLWIERDSMNEVASSGPEKNYISGNASSYELITSSPPHQTRAYLGTSLPDEFDEENHFIPGMYHIPGHAYQVSYSSGFTLGEDYVDLKGNLVEDNAGSQYDLYDDDYDFVTFQPRVSLPSYPDLGNFANEFRRAYIEPNYLGASFSDIVSFDHNLSWSNINFGTGDWNDGHDLSSSSVFWEVLSVSAYQYKASEDSDPETYAVFGTAVDARNELALYLEVIKENSHDKDRIMAHEIGHTSGLLDHSNCIMGDDWTFCDNCISQMRQVGNW